MLKPNIPAVAVLSLSFRVSLIWVKSPSLPEPSTTLTLSLICPLPNVPTGIPDLDGWASAVMSLTLNSPLIASPSPSMFHIIFFALPSTRSKENDAYKPSSPYSASKASSDHLVYSYIRTYGIPAIRSAEKASSNLWAFFSASGKIFRISSMVT